MRGSDRSGNGERLLRVQLRTNSESAVQWVRISGWDPRLHAGLHCCFGSEHMACVLFSAYAASHTVPVRLPKALQLRFRTIECYNCSDVDGFFALVE